MGTKEKVVPQDTGDDYEQKTERSPFDIMDDVQSGGSWTLASVSESVEKEIADEQAEVEGEGTGLKVFGEKPKAKEEEEQEAEEEDTEEEAEETTEDNEAEGEEESDENEEAEESDDDDSDEEKAEEEDDEPEEEEEKTTFEAPEWLAEKLKSFDENVDVTDPEAVQKTLDEVGSYKEKATDAVETLEKEKKANKAFYDLLEGSDELRQVARFMHAHEVPFEKAMAALEIQPEVDLETLKKEDPDAYLDIIEKKKEQEKQQAEAKKQREEREAVLQKNGDKSAENTEKFKKEFDLDDTQFNELTSAINPHLDNLADNLVTKNFLSLVHKGVLAENGHYDELIEQARQEGITEGKNMKIEDFKKAKQGDNLPNLDSKSPKRAEKEEEDVFSRALKPRKPISEIT